MNQSMLTLLNLWSRMMGTQRLMIPSLIVAQTTLPLGTVGPVIMSQNGAKPHAAIVLTIYLHHDAGWRACGLLCVLLSL